MVIKNLQGKKTFNNAVLMPLDVENNPYQCCIDYLHQVSPTVATAIANEAHDQQYYIKLKASENHASLAIQFASANLLVDLDEGDPQAIQLEQHCKGLVKKIFSADYVNVRPHSGCVANLIAFDAILNYRFAQGELTQDNESLRQTMMSQKLLGMSFFSGGHISHGWRSNISSKIMQTCCYDVDQTTEILDYDVIEAQVLQWRPLILLVGYSSYSRKIDFARFREMANKVNAVLMVDMAHFAGLVAGGYYTGIYNPVPYADIVTATTHKTLGGPRGAFILAKHQYGICIEQAASQYHADTLYNLIAAKIVAFEAVQKPSFTRYIYQVAQNAQHLANCLQQHGFRIVSGGTDNHLFVIDLTTLGLTGLQAEKALYKAGLIVNKNTIPFEQEGVMHTSGIRIGTSAVSSIGMRTTEMDIIANMISLVLHNSKPLNDDKYATDVKIDAMILKKIHQGVSILLEKFPLAFRPEY